MEEREIQGVCAGIGDRENDINVIDPAFDAAVRDFVIGQKGIISGFELRGAILSEGVCVACGFVGYLDRAVIVPLGHKVYGRFEIHHDRTVIDRFHVVTSEKTITTQDDILHEAGIFYLPLTNDNRLKYPLNAHHADNVTTVKAGGVAEGSTNLENGVTAVTQPLDDSTTNVATTEFVKNLITQEIDFGETTLYFAHPGTVYRAYCLAIKFKRKSKFVIGEVLGWIKDVGYTLIDNIDVFNLPMGFIPQKNTTCYLAWISSSPQSPATKYLNAYEYLFGINGTAKKVRGIYEDYSGSAGLSFKGCSFGYETI